MRIYKCHVTITTVRSGIAYVIAPDRETALDSTWVKDVDDNFDFDDLKYESETHKVNSVREMRTLEQVDKEYRDGIPWNHPDHEPKDMDATIQEFFGVKPANFH